MRRRFFTWLGILLCIALVMPDTHNAVGQAKSQKISTNKDKLITTAVQGQIAPAEPSRSYTTTWDGKPKMAIGIGGINYNLKIGDKVFGWASGDRATVGVATEARRGDRFRGAWLVYTSIGNEVKVLGGEARGKKGVVVGMFGSYVLVHFEDKVLEKLSVGNILQAKACGVGLQIEGFNDVFPHHVTPELLEKLCTQNADGKLEVPVVKEIPAEIVGQGSGGSSIYGNWHIQTCYPPDIKEYGLDELRFGDLVLLKDTQTDYGKGYYQGGATLGVVCSGPSDISGLGIGVTPILSTRSDKLTARIDSEANIGKYLGIKIKKSNPRSNPGALKTNKDKLITTAVEAVVQPAGSRGYSTTYDGKPKLSIGMASINYTVSLGDLAYGWANADHVEPDVTIQGRDEESPSRCAIAILACIGNEAKVLSGEARGAKGFYIGRHAGSDDLAWFPKNVLDKLALNDRIQVKARGVGLKIEGFEDVRVNKLSPELLENLGITIEGDQLVVPVVMEIPGHIMGSGIGGPFIEYIDYDIQTTDPRTVEQYDLKKIRLGDLIAIIDHYDYYGRGRYKDAVTIGVCIHGWSDFAGHGPGLNPVLSALPGKIKTKIDPHANVAYYLGLRAKPRD
ncbi:MAG: DUF4438 domain-containing protein [Candidatus Aminicenantes bacterium]|nr:MAG: DUF4438 domain-containing protein [Candidatus Aminicenantes bacterium]